MPQPENGPAQGDQDPKEQARSGGRRTPAGSNYGDWRPETDSNKGAGNDRSTTGTSPSTAPTGIGSTPHK